MRAAIITPHALTWTRREYAAVDNAEDEAWTLLILSASGISTANRSISVDQQDSSYGGWGGGGWREWDGEMRGTLGSVVTVWRPNLIVCSFSHAETKSKTNGRVLSCNARTSGADCSSVIDRLLTFVDKTSAPYATVRSRRWGRCKCAGQTGLFLRHFSKRGRCNQATLYAD